LAQSLIPTDPSSVSRTLQGFLSGIGFLGGAVIFKSGFDVKGIKAAAAVWITGAVGLAIATSHWLLGLTVGIATAVIMFRAGGLELHLCAGNLDAVAAGLALSRCRRQPTQHVGRREGKVR